MLRIVSYCVFVAIAMLVPVACQDRNSLATIIVGTWTRTGMDFSEETVYRADGTLDSTMYDGSGRVPFRRGKWPVEGDVLVEEYQIHSEPLPDQTPFPREVTRTRFAEVHRDRLVFPSE